MVGNYLLKRSPECWRGHPIPSYFPWYAIVLCCVSLIISHVISEFPIEPIRNQLVRSVIQEVCLVVVILAGGEEFEMKWITRSGVKVDRVACPWLIRKFIDPEAQFIFLPADQVLAEAAKLGPSFRY